MTSRLRAFRVLLTTVVLATTVVGIANAGAGSVPAQACNGSSTSAGGGWFAFRPPGMSDVTMQTGVPYLPDRIYASDGHQIVRTDDGGCNWNTLTLPAAPLVDEPPLPVPLPVPVPVPAAPSPNGSTQLVGIDAPSSSTANNYVYVAAGVSVPQPDLSAIPTSLPNLPTEGTQPYVFVSPDGGDHFSAYHSGLPTLGTIQQVVASTLLPTEAFAVVTDASGQASGIYRSGDGGQTWAQSGTAMPTSLRVNPLVPTELYGIFPGGLERSIDSGATWAPVSDTRSTASFDIASGFGYIQLVQAFSDSATFARSTNGGNTWATITSPVAGTEIAVAPLVNALTIGDENDLWLEYAPLFAKPNTYRKLNVTPNTGVPQQLVMAAPIFGTISTTGIIPTADGSGAVARLLFDVDKGRVDIVNKPVTLEPHVLHQFPSALYPTSTAVHLAPGAHLDVPYRLLLPRTPSPVDLMFLVDTTYSTDPTLAGVTKDLAQVVNELTASGLNVEFGLADFKDYPPDYFGNGEYSDYPYKLRRTIGPADSFLANQLSHLTASGGGDPDEADLTALYQSTTGAGQRLVNVDNKVRQFIPAGQDARYRADSLRLALIATDAAYHKESDYPTPAWNTVVNAMVANRVHQIGLAIQKVENNMPSTYDSLKDEQKMALETGAIAPIGGVDCNGDGVPDVAQGDPLVCKIQATAQKNPLDGTPLAPKTSPLHLANAIVELAANIPDLAALGIRVKGAPASVASVVSVPGHPVVNLRADNTVGFMMRYTCPNQKTGHQWSMTLEAVAGARPLTNAGASLVCDSVATPPPAEEEIFPAVATTVARAAPPNPPVNSSGNGNPNPALNPNAGFAQQEDQVRQLAFADADHGADVIGAEEDSTAMSRRRLSDEAEMLWMAGAAGLMMGGATAVARRRRNRPQLARCGTWR